MNQQIPPGNRHIEREGKRQSRKKHEGFLPYLLLARVCISSCGEMWGIFNRTMTWTDLNFRKIALVSLWSLKKENFAVIRALSKAGYWTGSQRYTRELFTIAPPSQTFCTMGIFYGSLSNRVASYVAIEHLEFF